MSKYESAEVPFQRCGNKTFLTVQQLVENPYLADFVKLFEHCFRKDFVREVYWYEPS